MFLPLRYSASGPVISNPDGGTAVPGQGFQLRLADNQDSTGALVLSGTQQAIPTPSGEFVVGLANPRPSLRYSAQCIVPIASLSNGAAVFSLGAQWRVDGGAWASIDSADRFVVDQQCVTNVTVNCTFNSLSTLGSALAAPVLNSSTLLEVQFTASVDSGAGQIAGNKIFARLIETL